MNSESEAESDSSRDSRDARDARDSSAYQLNTQHGGIERELERLRWQALLAWEREARNLKWFGLRDGMNVLDVGSGPGFITEQLLAMVPLGSVTGLEVDPAMLARARSYLAPRLGERLRLVEGSILSNSLPEGSFDFAYARLIMQHLSDPVGAARQIGRLLKRGGKLVILDIDDAMHLYDPEETPELKAVAQRFVDEHKAKGGNRLIGRRLLRVLREAGYKNVRLELLPVHSDEYGLETVAPRQGRAGYEVFLEEGFITPEELELLVQAEETGYGPENIVMYTIFMAAGEKP